MVVISGTVDTFSGFFGTILRTLAHHLTTGPLTVLSVTFVFAFMMGDVLAHAVLNGICIALSCLTGTRSMFWFMIGAAIAGMIATFSIGFIIRHPRIKSDTALAMSLSVFLVSGSCC